MTSGGQTLRPEEMLDHMKKLKLSLEEIEGQLQHVQIPHEALDPNQVQKFRATLEDTLSQLRKAY